MNDSIIRNSAVMSVGVRCMARFAALMLVSVPAIGFAHATCPGIHVKILNIRNNTGTVACALFESAAGFPREFLRSATKVMVMKVRETQARCDFEDIPPATYAIAVIHDENMNGELDTHVFGFPKEGYGFSNDAKGVLGVPAFEAARFPYDGQNLELTLNLNY